MSSVTDIRMKMVCLCVFISLRRLRLVIQHFCGFASIFGLCVLRYSPINDSINGGYTNNYCTYTHKSVMIVYQGVGLGGPRT